MGLAIEELVGKVEEARTQTPHLVIVTGNPGSGKSQILREAAQKKQWDYIDCRTLITEELISLLPAMRASKAPALMKAVLESYKSEVLLLDRVQSFFTPALQLDPVALLRKLSEDYTLVVAWPGYYKEGSLFFERSGEVQPLQFDAQDLLVWPVENYKGELKGC